MTSKEIFETLHLQLEDASRQAIPSTTQDCVFLSAPLWEIAYQLAIANERQAEENERIRWAQRIEKLEEALKETPAKNTTREILG